MILPFSALPAQATPTLSNSGYDISWPQCASYGATVRTPRISSITPPFAIVGVNFGQPFTANTCFGDEVMWAGGANLAGIYFNTANPGQAQYDSNPSKYGGGSWAERVTGAPKPCDASNWETADCAYNFGWNTAKYAFEQASNQFTALGLPVNPTGTNWWLDIEVGGNGVSWRYSDNTKLSYSPDYANLNVATLRGQIEYLYSAGVKQVGIYSAPNHWNEITNFDNVTFSNFPYWYPIGSAIEGRATFMEAAAVAKCTQVTGVTGGPIAMVQYVDSDFDQIYSGLSLDVNVPCTAAALPNPNSVAQAFKSQTQFNYGGQTSVASGDNFTVQATLVTKAGAPVANQAVNLSFLQGSYDVTTDANGVLSANLKAPSAKGTYAISLKHSGNNSYLAQAKSVNISVVPSATKFNYVGAKSVKRGRWFNIQAKLLTQSGRPVANHTVTIAFRGKSYTVKTNSQGTASKKVLAPAARGYYTVSIKHSGSSIYIKKSTTARIKVTY